MATSRRKSSVSSKLEISGLTKPNIDKRVAPTSSQGQRLQIVKYVHDSTSSEILPIKSTFLNNNNDEISMGSSYLSDLTLGKTVFYSNSHRMHDVNEHQRAPPLTANAVGETAVRVQGRDTFNSIDFNVRAQTAQELSYLQAIERQRINSAKSTKIERFSSPIQNVGDSLRYIPVHSSSGAHPVLVINQTMKPHTFSITSKRSELWGDQQRQETMEEKEKRIQEQMYFMNKEIPIEDSQRISTAALLKGKRDNALKMEALHLLFNRQFKFNMVNSTQPETLSRQASGQKLHFGLTKRSSQSIELLSYAANLKVQPKLYENNELFAHKAVVTTNLKDKLVNLGKFVADNATRKLQATWDVIEARFNHSHIYKTLMEENESGLAHPVKYHALRCSNIVGILCSPKVRIKHTELFSIFRKFGFSSDDIDLARQISAARAVLAGIKELQLITIAAKSFNSQETLEKSSRNYDKLALELRELIKKENPLLISVKEFRTSIFPDDMDYRPNNELIPVVQPNASLITSQPPSEPSSRRPSIGVPSGLKLRAESNIRDILEENHKLDLEKEELEKARKKRLMDFNEEVKQSRPYLPPLSLERHDALKGLIEFCDKAVSLHLAEKDITVTDDVISLLGVDSFPKYVQAAIAAKKNKTKGDMDRIRKNRAPLFQPNQFVSLKDARALVNNTAVIAIPELPTVSEDALVDTLQSPNQINSPMNILKSPRGARTPRKFNAEGKEIKPDDALIGFNGNFRLKFTGVLYLLHEMLAQDRSILGYNNNEIGELLQAYGSTRLQAYYRGYRLRWRYKTALSRYAKKLKIHTKNHFLAWKEITKRNIMSRHYCYRKLVAWRYYVKHMKKVREYFRICYWPFFVWRRTAIQSAVAKEKTKFLVSRVYPSLTMLHIFHAWRDYIRVEIRINSQVEQYLIAKEKQKMKVYIQFLKSIVERNKRLQKAKSRASTMIKYQRKEYDLKNTPLLIWRIYTFYQIQMHARVKIYSATCRKLIYGSVPPMETITVAERRKRHRQKKRREFMAELIAIKEERERLDAQEEGSSWTTNFDSSTRRPSLESIQSTQSSLSATKPKFNWKREISGYEAESDDDPDFLPTKRKRRSSTFLTTEMLRIIDDVCSNPENVSNLPDLYSLSFIKKQKRSVLNGIEVMSKGYLRADKWNIFEGAMRYHRYAARCFKNLHANALIAKNSRKALMKRNLTLMRIVFNGLRAWMERDPLYVTDAQNQTESELMANYVRKDRLGRIARRRAATEEIDKIFGRHSDDNELYSAAIVKVVKAASVDKYDYYPLSSSIPMTIEHFHENVEKSKDLDIEAVKPKAPSRPTLSRSSSRSSSRSKGLSEEKSKGSNETKISRAKLPAPNLNTKGRSFKGKFDDQMTRGLRRDSSVRSIKSNKSTSSNEDNDSTQSTKVSQSRKKFKRAVGKVIKHIAKSKVMNDRSVAPSSIAPSLKSRKQSFKVHLLEPLSEDKKEEDSLADISSDELAQLNYTPPNFLTWDREDRESEIQLALKVAEMSDEYHRRSKDYFYDAEFKTTVIEDMRANRNKILDQIIAHEEEVTDKAIDNELEYVNKFYLYVGSNLVNVIEKVYFQLQNKMDKHELKKYFRMLRLPMLIRRSKSMLQRKRLTNWIRLCRRLSVIDDGLDYYNKIRTKWIAYNRWLKYICLQMTNSTPHFLVKLKRRCRLYPKLSNRLKELGFGNGSYLNSKKFSKALAEVKSIFYRWQSYVQEEKLFREMEAKVAALYQLKLIQKCYRALRTGMQIKDSNVFYNHKDGFPILRLQTDLDQMTKRFISLRKVAIVEQIRCKNRKYLQLQKKSGRGVMSFKKFLNDLQDEISYRLVTELRILAESFDKRGSQAYVDVNFPEDLANSGSKSDFGQENFFPSVMRYIDGKRISDPCTVVPKGNKKKHSALPGLSNTLTASEGSEDERIVPAGYTLRRIRFNVSEQHEGVMGWQLTWGGDGVPDIESSHRGRWVGHFVTQDINIPKDDFAIGLEYNYEGTTVKNLRFKLLHGGWTKWIGSKTGATTTSVLLHADMKLSNDESVFIPAGKDEEQHPAMPRNFIIGLSGVEMGNRHRCTGLGIVVRKVEDQNIFSYYWVQDALAAEKKKIALIEEAEARSAEQALIELAKGESAQDTSQKSVSIVSTQGEQSIVMKAGNKAIKGLQQNSVLSTLSEESSTTLAKIDVLKSAAKPNESASKSSADDKTNKTRRDSLPIIERVIRNFGLLGIDCDTYSDHSSAWGALDDGFYYEGSDEGSDDSNPSSPLTSRHKAEDTRTKSMAKQVSKFLSDPKITTKKKIKKDAVVANEPSKKTAVSWIADALKSNKDDEVEPAPPEVVPDTVQDEEDDTDKPVLLSKHEEQFFDVIRMRAAEIKVAQIRVERFARNIWTSKTIRRDKVLSNLSNVKIISGLSKWYFNAIAKCLVEKVPTESKGIELMADAHMLRVKAEVLRRQSERLLIQIDALESAPTPWGNKLILTSTERIEKQKRREEISTQKVRAAALEAQSQSHLKKAYAAEQSGKYLLPRIQLSVYVCNNIWLKIAAARAKESLLERVSFKAIKQALIGDKSTYTQAGLSATALSNIKSTLQARKEVEVAPKSLLDEVIEQEMKLDRQRKQEEQEAEMKKEIEKEAAAKFQRHQSPKANSKSNVPKMFSRSESGLGVQRAKSVRKMHKLTPPSSPSVKLPALVESNTISESDLDLGSFKTVEEKNVIQHKH